MFAFPGESVLGLCMSVLSVVSLGVLEASGETGEPYEYRYPAQRKVFNESFALVLFQL
jgi:hypothetical protein